MIKPEEKRVMIIHVMKGCNLVYREAKSLPPLSYTPPRRRGGEGKREGGEENRS